MFEELIISALGNGPKTTPQLYDVARKRQPGDCTKTACTHRTKVTDFEWQHELRREQQLLKKDGQIELKNGLWQLRKK